MARWIALAFALVFAMETYAQTLAEQTAERIKSAPSEYYYGEGSGYTLEEARTNALAALSQAIKSVVWTDMRGEENNMGATISARTGISSFTTLGNTESIEFPFDEENRIYRVMQYMKRSELKRLASERADKIKEWTATGRQQEGRLEISSALKYYFWALCLCDVHSSSVKLDIDGTKIEAKPWLESKISNLLNSVEVSLDNIKENPGDANPYLVNLRFTINGQNVNGLELSYFTGLRRVDGIHAKNGEASLEFPQLPTDRISMRFNYSFVDEAKLFDPELEAYFQANAVRNFSQAAHDVKVNGTTASTFSVPPQEKPEPVAAATVTQAPVVAEVQIAPRRKLIETAEVITPGPFLEVMNIVEQAIASGHYDDVKSMFTTDGFNQFMRMMNSGTVKPVRSGSTNRRIEQAEGYVIGKTIPVQITYKGKRKCNENIVLRFTPDAKVSSVAYALSSRAEDDIFRKSRWGMKARYAMLTFMEDYQTAFALKDINYIDKIFDTNAVIINASVVPDSRNKRSSRKAADGYFVDSRQLQPKVRYVKRTKEQYLDYLRKDFANKAFIQLVFEETDIASQSGISDNIYWIELKQNYTSNTYSDVGYLTLMINLDEFDPSILVRTWTPEKLDLRDMMSRYTQD